MAIRACNITNRPFTERECSTQTQAMWVLLCVSGDYQACIPVISLAQQVWNKFLSLFLTINVGCLFSWGATIWGVLHSNSMLYEANHVHEAMLVYNKILISVSLFQQPWRHVRSVHVWKTMITVTLWTFLKCRCNQLYDASNIGLLDVLLKIWEKLLAVVRSQYDYGASENVNKRRDKLRHLWRKLPLFVVLDQGPQWNY